MEKQINDYLHYYLGCQILDTEAEPNDNISTMISVDTGGEVYDNHGNAIPSSELKLILRPLSDINYDDMMLWAAKCVSLGHTDAEGATEKDFEYAINHVKENGLKGFDFSNSPELVPESICFLTKQGFDLFGLIDAGLALDKTTINQQ